MQSSWPWVPADIPGAHGTHSPASLGLALPGSQSMQSVAAADPSGLVFPAPQLVQLAEPLAGATGADAYFPTPHPVQVFPLPSLNSPLGQVGHARSSSTWSCSEEAVLLVPLGQG